MMRSAIFKLSAVATAVFLFLGVLLFVAQSVAVQPTTKAYCRVVTPQGGRDGCDTCPSGSNCVDCSGSACE
jgi:hypothetical protein